MCLKSHHFVQKCFSVSTQVETVQGLKKCNDFNIYSEKQDLFEVTDLSQNELAKIDLYMNHENMNLNYVVLHDNILTKSDENELNQLNTDDLKPLQIQRNDLTNQTMKLDQYSGENVLKMINKIKERYSTKHCCLFCKFISKDLRAMSVHMTKLHM